MPDAAENVIKMVTPMSSGSSAERLSNAEPSDPLPITTAPCPAGRTFGPCLLYAPAGDHIANLQTCWFIGGWDGESWYALGSGYLVNPTAWRPLPKVPAW